MRIRLANWQDDGEQIRLIRRSVFVEEQNVPEELDFDGEDAACVHVLVFEDGGRPIATARMRPDGKVGRMAVLKPHRGRGAGTRMLETLLGEARRSGLERVFLHAQDHAVTFYEERGFAKEGDLFHEAGIPHFAMSRSLRP